MKRSSGADRALVALVGLVALLIGGYGMARGLGALGAGQSETVLLGEDLRRTMAENAGWLGGAATFAALVLAWSGWRWLRRQLVGASPPLRQVRVATGAGGHTSVEARALTEAVVRDVEAEPQVKGARARLVGSERAPALDLAVDLTASADPGAVRRHVEDHVVPRARTALERDDLTAHLRLRL